MSTTTIINYNNIFSQGGPSKFSILLDRAATTIINYNNIFSQVGPSKFSILLDRAATIEYGPNLCHISLLDCKYVQVKRAAKMEVPLPLLHLKSLRTRVFVSGPTINW